jgi:hypothetical protein
MSRAFRDTFNQTFCLCRKIDPRQSTLSFAAVKMSKHREEHLDQSVAFETVATYKCSENYQTNLSDNSNRKKKRNSIGLQFFNHTKSISS